ncbi:SGNH/GDSL hydrolase family protein [Frigoribacterium sp. PvP032]|uniref:SGNH/GDSL hydrolase family protein n=1 Tax=Frigoribacterium sp. PvP032 TaxID=2806589 RepID=UPI001AE2647B|nr:SGNH/GDSL hydrolase family protein [Frigoribacterium sp. PvP032]MBP1190621.1 lysophospholipase L1-like esterase [Frigoribacterium sp. PvP032]
MSRTRERVVSVLAAAVIVLGVAVLAASFLAVATSPGDPTASQITVKNLPQDPRVLVIGDSYTAGYGAEDPERDTWVNRTSASLDWSVTVDAVLGSGYTTVGGPSSTGVGTFGDRLSRHEHETFDLVVIQGSQNDVHTNPDRLVRAAQAALREAKDLWPDAAVVMIGPSAPLPRGEAYVAASETLRKVAGGADVPFVDAVNGRWFTTKNSPAMTAPDGGHLNTRGYAYMGDRITEAMRDLMDGEAGSTSALSGENSAHRLR